MKFLKQFSLVLALVSVAVGAEPTGAKEKEFQALYDEWTDWVQNGQGRLMSGPSGWFSTHRNDEHAERLERMLAQREQFGPWLAEMVARTQYPEMPLNPENRLYLDVHLLRFVAGIYLIAPDRPMSREERYRLDFDKMTKENQRWFAKAWIAGEFRNPGKAVAGACVAADEVNGAGEIAPWSLVAIRRYGIFGAPELVTQVENRNSPAAFASYLIIYGDSLGYSEYIKKPGEMYSSKERKLERMKAVSEVRKSERE